MARYKKPWAEVEAEVRANARGGDIEYQIDEARQMWDADPTSFAPQTRRETIQEAFNKPAPAPAPRPTPAPAPVAKPAVRPTPSINSGFVAYGNRVSPSQQSFLDDYKAMKTPEGSTYEKYMAGEIAKKQPPISPIRADTRSIRDNDEGDKDYQMDELNSYYQSDAGKKDMSDFYQKNSSWYNPDGQRTNKGFNADDIAAQDWIQGGRQGVNPVTTQVNQFRADRGDANTSTIDALRNPPPPVAPVVATTSSASSATTAVTGSTEYESTDC
jgi:hypothetical protein